jgi:hypothetical protein
MTLTKKVLERLRRRMEEDKEENDSLGNFSFCLDDMY